MMKTKNRKQQPEFGSIPPGKKLPRANEHSIDSQRPEFKTCKMDMNGKWGWSRFDPAHIQDFLNKLLEYQKLNWQELRQKGSHCVQISQIDSEARKRLQLLQLDDWEELYSLRLSGKPRVWGLKEAGIFWILWWDPEHEVCPSVLKHT